ncbi:F-box/LRR-repeat protein 7-like isoform X1 [Vespula maculifrons]|uniref:F-box/LRR-repeat protein 7-like isoform X1 n=1 Tax=Vespula maculifrons TaxID=7453 RepID=A0ABD2BC07_VESMC|nr:F-box/LRR-repeat protein 7-like isoform X1 [Vespula vulgaris]
MDKIEFFCEALKRIRIETENGADRITEEGVLPTTVNGIPIRKLFISNVAQRTTYKELAALFSKYGKVESCYLKTTYGKSNYAFVTFTNVMSAIRAREDGSKKEINLHNRDLKVMPADPWHQPDSIQIKKYTLTKNINKSHKKSSIEETNYNSVQNHINAPIDALNDDCLIHIFLYLPIKNRIAIERVCKRWRAVAQKSWYTVKKLDLSHHAWGISANDKKICTSDLREVLLRCGRFLNHIDISQCYPSLTRSTLLIIGRYCHNLEIVDISGLEISSTGIDLLAKNCTNIKKLNLGYSLSMPFSRHICDRDFKTLFEMNKGLRYLNLYQMSISGKCLNFLSSNAFEELVLNSCDGIQESYFANALANLTSLKSLLIKDCVCITSRILEPIGKYCTNLKEFELTRFLSVPMCEDALQITELVNLEILRLIQNGFINDDFLIALASKCKQLIYLDINGCYNVTDTGLQAVATLPKLETLIINNLDKVTAVGLDNMCNIRQLECRSCTSINDTGLAIIIHVSPNLEVLDLTGCKSITNNIIDVAEHVTSRRSNNIFLKIYIGGTSVTRYNHTSPNLLILRVPSKKVPENI